MRLIRAFSAGLLLTLCVSGCQSPPELSPSPPLIKAVFSAPDRVNDVAFSPGGRWLAAGYGWSKAGGVRVWDLTNNKLVAGLGEGTSAEDQITQLGFLPDGSLLAALNFKGTVFIWDVSSKTLVKRFTPASGSPESFDISADGRWLLVGFQNKVFVCVVERGECNQFAVRSTQKDYIGAAAFSPDGEMVVTGERDRVVFRRRPTGRKIGEVNTGSSNYFVKFAPSGKFLVVGGGAVLGRKTVVVLSAASKEKVTVLEGFRDGVFEAAFNHQGTLLAVGGGGWGGFFSLHEFPTGEARAYRGYGSSVEGLAFSPDGRLLAVGTGAGDVRVYSVPALRGPDVRRQGYFLCGEVGAEGPRAFFVPLSKVPVPMGLEFDYDWRFELLEPEKFIQLNGAVLALLDWEIHSSLTEDKLLVRDSHTLATALRPQHSRDYIVFGTVQNPEWNRGKILKIFSDGSFVAATNSGVCMAYGSLSQGRLDLSFEGLKAELISNGLLEIPAEPQALGFDHYRTRFIELSIGGQHYRRTDAERLRGHESPLQGKAEKFDQLWGRFEARIDRLFRAGRQEP